MPHPLQKRQDLQMPRVIDRDKLHCHLMELEMLLTESQPYRYLKCVGEAGIRKEAHHHELPSEDPLVFTGPGDYHLSSGLLRKLNLGCTQLQMNEREEVFNDREQAGTPQGAIQTIVNPVDAGFKKCPCGTA
ncbi:unnamed protein product [Leuciscus chuanchicus]